VTFRLVVGPATDVGKVRGQNEDAYLVDDQLGLVAVADGMGGHQAGEVASATALEALRAAVTSGEGIRDAVTSANEAVYDKSTTDERLRGMGTTLTAGTLATGGTLLVGHVGDSRAYLVHDGTLRRVTTDHSVVEELIQAGEITAAEAERDPRRSQITRALGIEPEVDVDLYPTQLSSGDRLLLCSDGLTGMVSEDEIAAILIGEPDPSAAARQLVAAANAAGGIDNITVLVVDVVDDEEPTVTGSAVAAPEEPVEEAPGPTGHPSPAAARRQSGRRRLGRILRWGLPIVVVVGVAIGVLAWYARNTYYVGTDLGNVAIFRGRPSGVLIWNPTLEQRTNVLANDLPPRQRQEVRDGHGQFSSVRDARAYVHRLSASTTTSTTTHPTTATTTTTTVKPGP
jgi:serine/threonine protein phosphatase PrpC